MTAAAPLLTATQVDGARRLVESQGLSWEAGCDEVAGIYEGGRLVATASRAGCVLKMFAIDAASQGGETLGQLVTSLVESGRRAGHDSLLVYTRPENAASFEQCNFRLLVAATGIVLLEWGGGLERYLARLRGVAASSGQHAGLPRRSAEGAKAGGIVLNGNPFTRGHQYLVESAAAQVERLFVFVVREEGSAFPFAARYRMAEEGTRHLENVVVLDTSRYAVSAATFPSYFLRRHDDRARLQMEVDARLFGRHLAPAAGVTRRFVGHEPYCETTAAYNRVMAAVLPEYGVDLVEVERAKDAEGVFVSATRVRAAYAAGDMETVRRLVPATTLAILQERG
jgi:[citrate (pro-3S)-lyase] ligase